MQCPAFVFVLALPLAFGFAAGSAGSTFDDDEVLEEAEDDEERDLDLEADLFPVRAFSLSRCILCAMIQ